MTGLKISMLFFLARLMFGLGRPFQIRIFVGFLLVIGSFIASIISIFASCRPFHNYWAVNPNPGSKCRPCLKRPRYVV